MLNFEDIHDAYYGKVVRYLRTIVGDDHAEDCAQEVFIKVHRGLDTLKDESKLSSWMYSIALNTARDALRSSRAGVTVVTHDGRGNTGREAAPPLIDRQPDPRQKSNDEIIAKKEMAQCYVDFVKKLPSNYYEIYVLSEFDGLPDAEIARRLSLSIQTVKIRLHRARTRLYEDLKENCSCYNDKSGELMCEPKE